MTKVRQGALHSEIVPVTLIVLAAGPGPIMITPECPARSGTDQARDRAVTRGLKPVHQGSDLGTLRGRPVQTTIDGHAMGLAKRSFQIA
jgi:hypothetical protein